MVKSPLSCNAPPNSNLSLSSRCTLFWNVETPLTFKVVAPIPSALTPLKTAEGALVVPVPLTIICSNSALVNVAIPVNVEIPLTSKL